MNTEVIAIADEAIKIFKEKPHWRYDRVLLEARKHLRRNEHGAVTDRKMANQK